MTQKFLPVLFLGFVLLAAPAEAQRQFVSIVGAPALEFAAFDAHDFDGDGDEDLFLTGMNIQGEPFTGIYRMVERRVTPVPNSSDKIEAIYERRNFVSRNLMRGTVDWVDLTGDGRADVLATGQDLIEVTTTTTELQPFTDIYVGGPGTLTFNASSGLPGVYDSQVATADFDGNGTMDIVLAGRTLTGLELDIFYNDPSGNALAFRRSQYPFEGLWATSVDVADLDGDGRPDLTVSGFDAQDRPVLRAWRNLGNDAFLPIELGIAGSFFSDVSLGDVDADGDVDLVLMGASPSVRLLQGRVQLFLNDGTGQFTDASERLADFGATPPPFFLGGTEFVDVDGDRDADMIMHGMTGLDNPEQQRIVVYEAIDGRLFQAGNVRGIMNGQVRTMDYDGDGRQDIFLMGRRDDSIIASIYEY